MRKTTLSIIFVAFLTALGVTLPTWMVDAIIGVAVPTAKADGKQTVSLPAVAGQVLTLDSPLTNYKPTNGSVISRKGFLMYDTNSNCYCYLTEDGNLRIPRCHSRHLLVAGKTAAPICEDRDATLAS